MSDQPGRAARDSRPESIFLLISAVFLTAAVALASRDSHPADGLYSALACLSAICGCGWAVWSVERRRQRDVAEQREMIAALRQDFAALRSALAQQSAGVYVAKAVGQNTVDTSNLRLVRAAREEGVEEGFVLGYQAQVADLNGRRLTRDS